MTAENAQPQAILSQRIDETYVLTIFKNRRSRLIEIPLGQDYKAALATANDLINTVKDVHGLDDKANG